MLGKKYVRRIGGRFNPTPFRSRRRRPFVIEPLIGKVMFPWKYFGQGF
jgi:hypothetical protein